MQIYSNISTYYFGAHLLFGVLTVQLKFICHISQEKELLAKSHMISNISTYLLCTIVFIYCEWCIQTIPQ